ncbi:hypothetical protein V6N13_042042 [Hibiscus sabdariffa]|uniref:Uncharacterized protein n=1 Tax=Hibiscus sabdariffa TaxID=183260 RepID=A0ABR2DDU5_9ROSI
MGKDWYWGSGAAKTPIATSSSKRAAAPADTTPTGCISAVFQFFDFHHFQLPLNNNQTSTSTQSNSSSSSSSCGCFKQPQSFLSPHSTFVPTTLKGTDAPRNSLESEESSASASLTSTSKDEENLNIPMGIQIKTRGDNRSKVGATNNDTSSEISSSPGTKTPTLVARLMGLDILPESHSPSFSSRSHLKPISGHRRSLDGDIRGTRSLPETPRISSSSRRSDVDLHHRLSLQINKENMSATEELMISRLKALKRKEHKHDEENRSPGHYARQIVKQVKQSVSRKVGLDITNTVRNREQAREELVSQLKYRKNSRAMNKLAEDSSPGKHSTTTPLCSPKLQPVAEEQDEQQKQQPPRAASKCKKGKKPQRTSDIIRNKQEEPFVRPSTANRIHIADKKCKKTPLSNDLLNITVPTLFPVKKDPSPPATKIPQKQVSDAGRPKRSSQLSSCSSQTYNKQEATYVHVPRHENIGDRCNDDTTTSSCTTTGEEAAEYHEYIARILRRTGLEKDAPLSLASWFSPSHPLNPSIFYYLEHFTTCNKKTSSSQLSLRCNRKLLFHLTDEILTEFLKPFFNMKPWVISGLERECFSNMNGSQLVDTLCSKITGFPRADCRVLEDIDSLIDRDLSETKLRTPVAYEEEGEGVVSEIEKDILEALVHETATDLGLCCTGFNFQRLSNRNVERARLLESHGSFT